MKRSALLRKSPLKRHTQLRSRPAPINRNDPARIAWKTPRAGFCECCGRFAMHLHRHHVVYEQIVRRAGGDIYAPGNGMLVCERCHSHQHSAFRRIPLERVPPAAIDFAKRLLGEDRALLFFTRYYGTSRDAL